MGAGASAGIAAAVTAASDDELAEEMKKLPASEREKIAKALSCNSAAANMPVYPDKLAINHAERVWAAMVRSSKSETVDASSICTTAAEPWGTAKYDATALNAILGPALGSEVTAAQWREVTTGAEADFDKLIGPIFEVHTFFLARALRECGLQGPYTVQAVGAPAIEAAIALQRKQKLVHFIRHGQGNHNLRGDQKDSTTVDPPLNATGQAEARDLQASTTAGLQPELVVASPFRRTMETAALGWAHIVGKVPFVCHDGCREVDCFGPKSPENSRRSADVNAQERYGPAPGVEFAFDPEVVSSDTDVANAYETDSALASRMAGFMHWLGRRPERHIAVVGHTLIFKTMFKMVMDSPDDIVRGEMNGKFRNCEMRSLLLEFDAHEDALVMQHVE